MTEKKKPVVVGIGEILWDMLPGGRRAGGAPINFVYHAAAMGAEGYAISAVGNDPDGDEILRELNQNGIAHLIARVPRPTGKVLVELKNGIPSYTIVEDVAWDYIPCERRALEIVRRADAVCYGTLASRTPVSRRSVVRLLEQAPSSALKFFDVNLRGRYYDAGLIREFLNYADVFKINDDEILTVRRLFSLAGSDEEVCRTLSRTHRLYIVTNAVASVQRSRLHRSAVAPYITDAFISEEAGASKPSRAYFNYVFARIPGITQKNCLLIGDSPSSDIRGANNAGIP